VGAQPNGWRRRAISGMTQRRRRERHRNIQIERLMNRLKLLLTLIATLLALGGCAELNRHTVTQTDPFNQMHGQ
jgi:hypothetical protein